MALAVLAGLVLVAWTGWLTPVESWRSATGWDLLPADRRPASAVLWEGSDGPAPELFWLGHAGFVLRWHDRTLLLDPNTSTRCTVSKRILEPSIAVADLGPIDAVVISHAHFDHLDLPTLEAIPVVGTIVVPRGSEAYLSDALRARARVVGLDPDERTAVGPLEIVAVPAAHNGNRFHPLASDQQALGYVVRSLGEPVGGDAVFFAGDTGYGPHLAEIGRRYRPRAAILPIGAFSPRLILKPYHLSPEEAVIAARDLGVETAVPGHFGTFTLFLDRPNAALPRFAAAARAADQRWILAPFLGAALRALPEDAG